MDLFPRKGRSEGDASTKVIASLTALTTQNPRRNKIYSQISSIIPGKEFNQITSDKVGNETANKQVRTSTNQEEKKENKNTFPTTTNVYCTLHSKITFHKLPTVKLTNYIVK